MTGGSDLSSHEPVYIPVLALTSKDADKWGHLPAAQRNDPSPGLAVPGYVLSPPTTPCLPWWPCQERQGRSTSVAERCETAESRRPAWKSVHSRWSTGGSPHAGHWPFYPLRRLVRQTGGWPCGGSTSDRRPPGGSAGHRPGAGQQSTAPAQCCGRSGVWGDPEAGAGSMRAGPQAVGGPLCPRSPDQCLAHSRCPTNARSPREQ